MANIRHNDGHNLRLAVYSLLLLASFVTLGVVNMAEAQFASPTCTPPTCSPVVIQSTAANVTAQTASINVSGTIKGAGCFGATYAGVTSSIASVALANGYKSADALCNAAVAGSHVCRVEEVLESIRCGVALPNGTNAWVNGGPPGYTSYSDDCAGWTNNTAAHQGRFWQFSSSSGGVGTMTVCSETSLPYACCK